MRTLVFSCPTTGASVDSGVAVEASSLPFAVLFDLPVRCPHCRERHIFQARHANLSKAD
jgi:hypothetical protein